MRPIDVVDLSVRVGRERPTMRQFVSDSCAHDDQSYGILRHVWTNLSIGARDCWHDDVRHRRRGSSNSPTTIPACPIPTTCAAATRSPAPRSVCSPATRRRAHRLHRRPRTRRGRPPSRRSVNCTASTPARRSSTASHGSPCRPIVCRNSPTSRGGCSSLTGWRVEAAPGLAPIREFYGSLGERRFMSTQYVRHPSVPLYTPEPDVIHEVVGHCNSLGQRAVRRPLRRGRCGEPAGRRRRPRALLEDVLVHPRVRRRVARTVTSRPTAPVCCRASAR